LNFGAFLLIANGIGLALRDRRSVSRNRRRIRWTAAGEYLKEILMEYQTEQAKDNGSADTDVHAAKAASAEAKAATAAAVVTTVFDVAAGTAWCPFHWL
jgi:hypothetical protein